MGKKHTDPDDAGDEAGRAVIQGATSRPHALLRGDREGEERRVVPADRYGPLLRRGGAGKLQHFALNAS